MRVVVPYAVDAPKTRLASLLTASERRSFADAVMLDVLDAVRATGREPTVLATGTLDVDAQVVVDDRPLSKAVNAVLAETDGPVAVVMADLALATPDALERAFSVDGDVVIAAGLGGGTNVLVVRHPGFRVDYHGTSYRDHLAVAADVGASVTELDSLALAVDVDEPEDLVEVFLHTDGRAREWLVTHGFELDIGGGRVAVTRVPGTED